MLVVFSLIQLWNANNLLHLIGAFWTIKNILVIITTSIPLSLITADNATPANINSTIIVITNAINVIPFSFLNKFPI